MSMLTPMGILFSSAQRSGPAAPSFLISSPHTAGSLSSRMMALPSPVAHSAGPRAGLDYQHRVVFVTERERFEVPVRAIGPRAILDFRDKLLFPVCPVKSSTEKTQHVRNIGNGKAKFKLDTQSPFSVTPSSGTVDVGGSVQVTVDFHPMTVGVHSQPLVLHYHTGEDVHISLQGVSEELDIHLEADSVLLTKTYMSVASHRTVSLTYRSEIPLKYFWTTWPSLQEEALSLLSESSGLAQEEFERKRLLAQCKAHPTVIHRLPLLSRALQERRSQTVRDHRLVLSHSCITMEPAEGEIWPRTPAQFHIVFKPEEAKLYQQTIYCDITGREARLTLTIMAEGIGPNVQFNYDLMDMQNVVIGDTDYYEVKVRNKGRIDAPFRLSSRDTTFGRCFSFCPEEGVLPSGACQNVEVIFCSHTLGTFTEDLLLTVTGRPQPLTVTFRCVVPAIVVETPVLNFQRCFLDHRYEQKVQLTNTGPLPACYGVLDQEYEESPSLLIGSSTPTGMIRPHSSEEFPVFLLAKAVGLYASLCLAASSHPRRWSCHVLDRDQ